MTVIVATLVPSGIVIASDSRQVTQSASKVQRVASDNAQKIFQLNTYTAAAICGLSTYYLDNKNAPTSIEEAIYSIIDKHKTNRNVYDTACRIHSVLNRYFERHIENTTPKPDDVTLFIVGYDDKDNIGKLYRCSIPGDVVLEKETTDPGLIWGGAGAIIDRIILGFDPLLYHMLIQTDAITHELEKKALNWKEFQLFIDFQTLPLQDAVDLTYILAQTSIEMYNLSSGLVGNPGQYPLCGGPIDLAIITRKEGFQWLQKKQIKIGR